jgi:hypothetical protein
MLKGAIQVSIGFLIVMVISALVMIFMMGWLSGMFPELTEISEYATAQAEQQMMNEFAKGGDTILATIPTQQTFAPGSLVRFKIGVRKTAAVDDKNIFTMCIGKLTGSTCVSAGDGGTDKITVDPSIPITFEIPRNTQIKDRGDISLMPGVMEISSTTNPGLYSFRIYVCAEDASASIDALRCSGLTESYGQYGFIVEVK